MSRGGAVVLAQLRTSVVLALHHRWEALADALLAVGLTALTLVPIGLVFDGRASLAGHPLHEVLGVLGVFTMLHAVLEGVIAPSFAVAVEHLRTGTLDHVLLMPADAQLIISTARWQPFRLVPFFLGGGILAYAAARSGRAIGAVEVGLGVLLFVAAVVMLHAIWTLMLVLAFRTGRLHNARDLFRAVFDAGRWPATLYRGAMLLVLTFVVPLAPLTTYPAQAFTGTIEPRAVLGSIVGALALALLARHAFHRGLARHTSAGA